MAKNTGRLAGLAALAGAAYMMSRGKDATGPAATAAEKEASDARAKAQKDAVSGAKKTESANEDYSNEGYKKPKIQSESKSAPVSKQSVKAKELPKADLRDAEAGNSRGSRSNSSGTSSSSEEGMKNYKSRAGSLAGAGRGFVNPPSVTPQQSARDAEAGTSRGTRTTSTAGAGRGSVNPSSVTATDARSDEAGMSRGTRTTSTAGAGRGSVSPPVVKPSGPRDSESGMSRGTRPPVVGGGRGTVNPASVTPQQSSRDAEAGMSRGRREMTPSPGQAQVDTVRRLQSAARVPSSRAGMPGFDETGRPMMAGRRGYDEAGNPMKKGGAVKKMASGGMTASRRADGIATRGKTKCKMY
jgi:hypothetical protein